MKLARPIKDKNPRITQEFSSTHHGIDYGYIEGTPVYASGSGTVIQAKTGEKRQWIANTTSDPYKPSTGIRQLTTQDYGNYIKIDHVDGISTLVAHLKYMSNLVKVGDFVTIGQMIAQVGSTGNSSGNHTHYEVRKNNICINPSDYIDDLFDQYFVKTEEDIMAADTSYQNFIDRLNEVFGFTNKPRNPDELVGHAKAREEHIEDIEKQLQEKPKEVIKEVEIPVEKIVEKEVSVEKVVEKQIEPVFISPFARIFYDIAKTIESAQKGYGKVGEDNG